MKLPDDGKAWAPDALPHMPRHEAYLLRQHLPWPLRQRELSDPQRRFRVWVWQRMRKMLLYYDRPPIAPHKCDVCKKPYANWRYAYSRADGWEWGTGKFGVYQTCRHCWKRKQRAEYFGGECALCRQPLKFNCHNPTDPLMSTDDHIWPRKLGGNNDADNMQIVHRRCNTIKGTKVGAALDAKFPNRLNREVPPVVITRDPATKGH